MFPNCVASFLSDFPFRKHGVHLGICLLLVKTRLLLPDVLPQLFLASVCPYWWTGSRCFCPVSSSVGPAILPPKRGRSLRTISAGRRSAVVRVAKAPAPLFMLCCVWMGRPLHRILPPACSNVLMVLLQQEE